MRRNNWAPTLFRSTPSSCGSITAWIWNGFQVFASEQRLIVGYRDWTMQGFVEENLIWRDVHPPDVLLFASTGDDCYGLDLDTNTFCGIDRVSGDVFEEYESFDHMISSVLSELLE